MSSKWFFIVRNIIITLLGMALTGYFYLRFGDLVKPLVFTVVVLAFSMLHSILFSGNGSYKFNKNLSIKYDEMNDLVEKINDSVKTLRSRSKDNSRLLLISQFMDTIDEFEDAIPELIKDYRKGLAYTHNNLTIQEEVAELEKKAAKAKGSAKQIYEKALIEKRTTVNEIENINNSLEESESRLHLMLSTLQKIQAIVEVTELDDELSDEDATSLNTHLESFSENLKDVIRTIKL